MSPAAILQKGKPRVDRALSSNTALWRYLDAAKFLDFLHSGILYFCRGDQFQDKFEGTFTKSLKERIEASYVNQRTAFTYEEFRKRLREKVFINCWHANRDDSMAMWSIYGRSSCSVAITTTVGQLKRALQDQHLPYYLSIDKVSYIKHWRDPELDISPYSRIFAYKLKAYEFEKEVRILIDRFEDEFEDPIDELGMRVNVPVNDLLRSVVIAPEAPGWFVELIKGITAKYGVTVQILRSKLATDPI